MKHTLELYDKIFNLGELFAQALRESDSRGKRRTFEHIRQLLAKHVSDIDGYLATPMPEEPPVPYRSTREENPLWMQQGMFYKYQLRRELNGGS